MASLSTNDIRTAFLDYYAANGHTIVESSPLVPHNDPTLLFTNAGMVQFKNVFTGVEKRDYARATTSQKCVRAGGKHNDLDNVGYTARHHTFFEMLGNFSFGDYFKDVAIELAWNLVTKEYGLNPDRLWVTVYHTDDQAFDLWRKISGLPEERIIRIDTLDNFWAMGDTGPCGPCSEIFYDHGPAVAGGPPGSPDQDGDRYIEIWNLVFMQFEQMAGGERTELPRPSIDTGMGLERIAALLQGKHDNYNTDLFQTLIGAIAAAAGTDPEGPHKSSHRVIADHLRASSFLLADGVMPSNEGRGYVLRRIMRRAMRHAQLMGVREPLMWRLVPALVGEMGQAFPELGRAQALVEETLKLEEVRFQETLERGLRLLSDETDKLGDGTELPGEVAFKLYDTYGFPLDLTQDALREQGRTVDTAGFDAAMEQQRATARASWAGSGEAATESVWFDIREKVGASEFLGYSAPEAEAQVAALVVDGEPVERAEAGQKVAMLTSQTPFYGESGGQMGDTGMVSDGDHVRVQIDDTAKKLGDMHVHMGTVLEGAITVGQVVHMAVDDRRRAALRRNHSATHLLHAALRKHLGDHVTQKGSLVAPDRLRFDVSHPKPMADTELAAIEAEVNREVLANSPVSTLLMSPSEAVEKGALALFGEKYGDEVRVVSMGGADPAPYSTELCGGTHVSRTGDIGLFKLVSEGAVASGVRRIEAVTGEGALAYVNQQGRALGDAALALKAAPGEVAERITGLLADRKKLERELAEARRQIATGGGGGNGSAGPETVDVSGVTLAARKLDGVPAKELRGMADAIKKQIGSGVVAIVAVTDGKAAVVVGVTEDLTDRLDAVTLVRAGAQALGGKGGGGRPDMAQAGGPNAGAADEALGAIKSALEEIAEAA
jgi:alanyl-tRNA synthetase